MATAAPPRSAPSGLRDQLAALPLVSSLFEGSVPRAQGVIVLRALVVIGEEMGRLPGQAPAWLATAELALRRGGADPQRVDTAVVQALLLAQRMRIASLRAPSAFAGFRQVLESDEVVALITGAMRSLEHSEVPPSIPASRVPPTRSSRDTWSGDLPHSARRIVAVDAPRGSGPQSVEPLSRAPGSLASAPPRETREDEQGHPSESGVRLRVSEGTLSDDVIAGVSSALAGLSALLDSARTFEGSRSLSLELNRDAGTHAVPSDVREMKAALRAGEESWRSFTYYEARYGERGRRFTRSDSAWLVTLVREQGVEALQQVRWLASVLAARGMPRLLLELHLEVLYTELAASVPEQRTIYLPLKTMADSLRDARQQAISPSRTRELIAAFVAAAPAGALLTPSEGGTLLVAALADELAGVPRALQSLTDWLSDPMHFAPAWRDAVEATLRTAQPG